MAMSKQLHSTVVILYSGNVFSMLCTTKVVSSMIFYKCFYTNKQKVIIGVVLYFIHD